MMTANGSLLPYIMDLLSRQRDLKLEKESLCENVKDAVISDYLTPFNGNVEEAITYALELGTNLGLLSLSENVVRVAFNYRKPQGSKNIPQSSNKDNNDSDSAIVLPTPKLIKKRANNRLQPRRRPATYRPVSARYQIHGFKRKPLMKRASKKTSKNPKKRR